MSLHYSTQPTRRIEPTVRSIRYFRKEKMRLLFCPVNW